MGNSFSNFVFKNITDDEEFNYNYNRLLVDYSTFLFCKSITEFDNGYRILLRYADLLSLSKEEVHQNLAQQIAILMSQLFKECAEVQIVKESVYENVSNFASLSLLETKQLLPGADRGFLRSLEVELHKISNKIPNTDACYFDAQKSVIDDLNSNQYYSFSAPTSMGKTFIILNFIKNKIKNQCNENFVIIVPTRALLSEIANNIINEFKE